MARPVGKLWFDSASRFESARTRPNTPEHTDAVPEPRPCPSTSRAGAVALPFLSQVRCRLRTLRVVLTSFPIRSRVDQQGIPDQST